MNEPSHSNGTIVSWTNGIVSRKTFLPLFGKQGKRLSRMITEEYLFCVSDISVSDQEARFYVACYNADKTFLGWLGDRNKPFSKLNLLSHMPRGTVYIIPVFLFPDDREINPKKLGAMVSIEFMSPEDYAAFDPAIFAYDSRLSDLQGRYPSYPATVAESCRLLGCILPPDSCLPNPPSAYCDLEPLFSETDTNKVIDFLNQNGVSINKSHFNNQYLLFLRRFRQQNLLFCTNTDLLVWFTDWKLFARPRGFSVEDYFSFQLYRLSPWERNTFIHKGYRNSIKKLCTPWKLAKNVADKCSFNRLFPSYVKREWLDTEACSFEQFESFLARHSVFFAKPSGGTQGAGTSILRAEDDTPKNLFRRCHESGVIVEELINQHPTLNALNPSSVNTARVYTLYCADNIPRIMTATMRAGRSGGVVDNFHHGGLGVRLDPESGATLSYGIDSNGRQYYVHPDSGIPFRGFVFPCWDKVRAAVLDAASQVPDVRCIGWDIAVTASETVEFVEGNTSPGMNLPQSGCREGIRPLYEPYLKEIAALNGNCFPENEEWYLP